MTKAEIALIAQCVRILRETKREVMVGEYDLNQVMFQNDLVIENLDWIIKNEVGA